MGRLKGPAGESHPEEIDQPPQARSTGVAGWGSASRGGTKISANGTCAQGLRNMRVRAAPEAEKTLQQNCSAAFQEKLGKHTGYNNLATGLLYT